MSMSAQSQNNFSLYNNKEDMQEPSLPFNLLSTQQENTEYIGSTEGLWSPYTNINMPQFELNKLDSVYLGPIAPHNFDGVLEADDCYSDSSSLSDSEMDSISDVGLTDNSDEVNDTENSDDVMTADNLPGPCKPDETVCGFRGDSEQFRGSNQHENNNQNNHCSDVIDSIIPSIIADEKLARQIYDQSPRDDRSRFRGTELTQMENSYKSKHQDKAKPGLPEAGLLQEATGFTTTNNWEVIDQNNVVVHQCGVSCSCMAEEAAMYSDAAYYSQDSF